MVERRRWEDALLRPPDGSVVRLPALRSPARVSEGETIARNSGTAVRRRSRLRLPRPAKPPLGLCVTPRPCLLHDQRAVEGVFEGNLFFDRNVRAKPEREQGVGDNARRAADQHRNFHQAD
jgi:hypothetical protein